MAGFQVSIYGRFWVSTEARMDDHDEIERLRQEVRRLKRQIHFLEARRPTPSRRVLDPLSSREPVTLR